MVEKIKKSDAEWAKILTPEQFRVTRQKGTERAHSGALCDEMSEGEYRCICCQSPLFSSETKYHSGSGWPSFWAPIQAEAIDACGDDSLGMQRVEVTCARCGAHLGHVFEDGPKPSGLRYCINSVSLDFKPKHA